MNKTTKNLLKQAKKRGQTVTLLTEGTTTRCPCWSTKFQQPDIAWHEANPSEPECNKEGYLVSSTAETEAHVFVIPYEASSRREIPQFDHYIQQLGPIQQNDHLLLAPELPDGVKTMLWTNKT